ncbi:DUF1183-domain-containing protein [Boletus reticuloceps]|uniref:Store-operated calcium entry-associated regulatory factor n=1 Tax=Boletus reticuloceps TaxID=495285 RepID=A0A8I2YJA7_9AGAM|nr:DUF1183-domain-containing protein [Boletus reticuloceps]
MSRIALENIPAITFHKGSLTAARRTAPIAQLVCLGKPCAMYQPEVVRCRNIGGSGVNVDWKASDRTEFLLYSILLPRVQPCTASTFTQRQYLEQALRLIRRTELVQKYVPGANLSPKHHQTYRAVVSDLDTSGILFMLVWFAVLAIILYNSCLRRNYPPTGNTQRVPPPTYPGSDDYGRPGRGFFPGDYPGPPPPYTKDPSSAEGWRPGFWSGAALGALGGSLLNRSRSVPGPYDWEGSETRFRTTRRRESFDRMEGSSNMGDMGPLRTSTGYGGSNSR